MTDRFERNKFKETLAIIDSNKFNYRNKIGKFKYIGIRDLVNNIRNNTIRELFAKKSLNTLNKIKDAEIIKHKKHTPKHKELLNLFNDLLDTILTEKTLESKSQEHKNENENENENKDENDKALMSSKDDIENENENDKTLMSSNEDDDDDDDDDETIDQNKKMIF